MARRGNVAGAREASATSFFSFAGVVHQLHGHVTFTEATQRVLSTMSPYDSLRIAQPHSPEGITLIIMGFTNKRPDHCNTISDERRCSFTWLHLRTEKLQKLLEK